ncbi:hypothetical protein [uncultured Serinicoccus sp.]|nr:hypothetical protein [uncultured Serinicoccus sp.]
MDVYSAPQNITPELALEAERIPDEREMLGSDRWPSPGVWIAADYDAG